MKQWRITKYNPALRDPSGAFLPDEWTAFGDIGRSFAGEPLTLPKYEAMEDRYIAAAIHFTQAAGVKELKAVDVDQGRGELTLSDGMPVSIDDLAGVIRHILREQVWCKLERWPHYYLHFGYDYYMYIGSQVELHDSIAFARSIGLFVEEVASPYLRWN